MKKIALALLALTLAVTSHAASALKTFTTHTQGGPVLYVAAGESFDYSISGTFVGTVRLERSDNGVNYETTGLLFSAPATGNHINDTRKGQAYRVYCTTHTSGSIVTSLSDVADQLQEFKNRGGITVLRILDNGIEVPGTITAGSISGAVAVSGVDLSTVTAAIATKQDNDADLTDLADGSLTGSKVGSGIAAANIASGALAAGVSITPGGVDLSTVTTAIGARVDKAGDTMTGTLNMSNAAITVTPPGAGTAISVGTNSVVAPSLLSLTTSSASGAYASTYLINDGGARPVHHILSYTNAATNGGALWMRRARGTIPAPLAVVSGDDLGNIFTGGYAETSFSTNAIANIRFRAAENFTTGSNMTQIVLQTTKPGQIVPINNAFVVRSDTITVTSDAFFLNSNPIYLNGNVGVNISVPTEKLHVVGNILGTSSVTASGFFGNSLNLSGSAEMTGPSTFGVSPATSSVSAAGIFSAVPGSKSVPSYSFSNDPNTGVFLASSDALGISAGGLEMVRLDFGNLAMRLDHLEKITWGSGDVGTATDTSLYRASAGVLRTDGALDVLNSSVTASGFFGNGAGLTGVLDGTKVLKAGDTMTGALVIGTMTISAIQPPDSQALCIKNGTLGYCTSVVGVTGGCTCAAP